MKNKHTNHNYNDNNIRFSITENYPIATRTDFRKRILTYGRVTYDGQVLPEGKWHSDRDKERLLKEFDDFHGCMGWFVHPPSVIKRVPVSVIKKAIEESNGVKNIPGGIVLLAALAKGYSIGISKKTGEVEIQRRCGGVQTPDGE